MSRSFRPAVRVAAAAVLGLTLAGVASAPALATESGVITKPFGYGYPDKGSCSDQGSSEMTRQGADAYTCYPSNGKWDGYLTWYT